MAGQTISVSVLADTKKFSKAFQDIGNETSGLRKLAGGLKTLAVGVAALGAAAGAGAFKLGSMASEAEQSLGAVDAVLGSSARQFKAWTDENAAAFGLTEQVANQAGAQYAALGKNLGIAEKDLADFGQRGIETAADMAAAFGGDTTEALDALGAGLRGEFDQLEKYGVKLSADLVKRKQEAEGITAAAATELLIQEQLGGVIGQNKREYDTWAATTARIKADMLNTLTAAGGIVLPVMELGATLVEALIPAEQLEEFFERGAEKVQGYADGLRAVFEEAGGGLAGVKAVGTEIFDSIQDGLANAVDTAVAWVRGGGIQELVMGFLEWREKIFTAVLEAAPGIVEGLASALPDILRGVLSMVQGIVKLLADSAPKLLDAAAVAFEGIIEALVEIIPPLLTTLVGALPKLVKTLLGMLPKLLTSAVKLFSSLVEGLLKAIPEIINALLDLLPELIETILGMIPDLVTTAIELFVSLVEALAIAVPQIIEAVAQILPKLVTTLIEMIPTIIITAIELFLALITGLAKALPKIIVAIVKMLPQIIEAIISIIPALIDAGADLLEGLLDGIEDYWPDIKRWFSKTLPKWIDDILKTADTWLKTEGVKLLVGLLAGILEKWRAVRDWFRDRKQAVKDFFSSAGDWLVQSGKNIIQGIRDGIRERWIAARDWFRGRKQAVKDFFSTAGDWIYNAGWNIIKGFLSGLKDKYEDVKDFIKGIGSWIADNKGPKAYDLKLLVKNGGWIMQSLETGLKKGLPRIKRTLGEVAKTIQDTDLGVLEPSFGGNGRLGLDVAGAALAGGGNYYNIAVTVPVGASAADVGRELVKYIEKFEQQNGRRRG